MPELTDRAAAPGRRLTLAVLCLAPFLAVVDTVIVAIALPAIDRQLGFAAAGVPVAWVLNGYALALGGLLLGGGRLADSVGPRRVFIVGLLVFGVASAAAGLAPPPWLLVLARVAQGVGAAAFQPAALAMLTLLNPAPGARNRAIGAFGAAVGLGYLAGMVLGGALTDWLGWRAVLFVNVPVAVVAGLGAFLLLPGDRPHRPRRSLDLAGAVTFTAALAALLVALAAVPDHGWLAWATVGPAALGLGLLVLFGVIERRAACPLVPLSVVRVPGVMLANGAELLKSCVGIAQLYVLTLYFQDVLAQPPLRAGLLFVPMAVVSILAGPVGGRLVTALGLRPTAIVGLVLLGGGLLAMALALGRQPLWPVIGAAMVAEVGFMIVSVPLTILATVRLPEAQRGLGAGLLGTASQLGNAVGLGVVATVITVFVGAEASASALITGLQHGLVAASGCVALAVLPAAIAAGKHGPT